MRRAFSLSILVLLLLNAADFALTRLLCQESGGAYEANPVAAWWLMRFGWLGLAGFKAALVFAVVGIAVLLIRHRPKAAWAVLGVGCVAAAFAVFAGARLAYSAEERSRELADVTTDEVVASRLDDEVARGHCYRAVLLSEANQLGAGKSTLRDSVKRLGETDKASDPVWLSRMRFCFGPMNREQCLAINLVETTLTQFRDRPLSPLLVRRMFRELREICGQSLALLPDAPALSDTLRAEARRAANRRGMATPSGRPRPNT
jgi:hypothetical protein